MERHAITKLGNRGMKKFDKRSLPPGIGPHEEMEFLLMKKGLKYVAMFPEYIPPGVDDFLDDEIFSSFSIQNRRIRYSFETLFVYRRSHESEARELAQIMSTYGKKQRFDPALERRIGQILCYSEKEITAWLRINAKRRHQRSRPKRTRR
jgi:hypothetical protein